MKDNRGITLVELIVSMAILGVVGLMAVSLLASSTKMYRTTISYADIQSESQTVSRRVAGMIMNASNIYLDESEKGIFLFTGSRTENSDATIYGGEILWFDKAQGRLYQNSSVSVKVSSNGLPADGAEKNPLTAAAVSAALTGGADGREYLISDKVKDFKLKVSPEPVEKTESGGSYYVSDKSISLQYSITFTNLEKDDYLVSSSATPRNRIGELRIRKDSVSG